MDCIPRDIVKEIFVRIADTRPLGATCRAFRAIFIEIDGPFWRARGVARARLATPRTASLVFVGRLIAADNLTAFKHLADDECILSDIKWFVAFILSADASNILGEYLQFLPENLIEQLMMRCVLEFAVKCLAVLRARTHVSVQSVWLRFCYNGDYTTAEIRAKLPLIEQMVQTVPEFNQLGNCPAIDYIIVKNMTDPVARAAVAAQVRANNATRIIGTWAAVLHELAPEMFDPIDPSAELSIFCSDVFDAWNWLLIGGRPGGGHGGDMFNPAKIVLTHKKMIRIGHKIFKVRRQHPELLVTFGELLDENGFSAGAALCRKFAVETVVDTIIDISDGVFAE